LGINGKKTFKKSFFGSAAEIPHFLNSALYLKKNFFVMFLLLAERAE
jgi:hypothetical protein